MQVETLADVEVQTTTGTPRRLGEVWRDRPAVVVFVRHFG